MALDFIGGPATVEGPAPYAERGSAAGAPVYTPTTPLPPPTSGGSAGSAPAPQPVTVTPDPPTPPTPTVNSGNLIAELRAMFPWLDRIGFDPGFFRDLAATATNEDEVMAKVRQTTQYRQRFPGLWRQDGSLRMNESQYLAREEDYRTLLRQNGYDQGYDSPSALVGFFESELDPNELKTRLDTFRAVKESGQDFKDAFYVYAGMQLSDEQLYEAAVDPAAGQRLTDEYNARVAAQPFDYETWITRATQQGLNRVSNQLGELQKTGTLTGGAVQGLLRTDPTFARSVMDALYHGGDPEAGDFLNLGELMSAFEQAAIGAAARGAGLELPSKERAAQLRQAGVDRSKASAAYVDFYQRKGVYQGAVGRAFGEQFSQNDFEDAALLGNGRAADKLTRAMAQEKAAGENVGNFGMNFTRDGRLIQRGLKAPGF